MEPDQEENKVAEVNFDAVIRTVEVNAHMYKNKLVSAQIVFTWTSYTMSACCGYVPRGTLQ